MSHLNSSSQVTIAGTGAMACFVGARLSSVARVTLTGSWAEGIRTLRASGIKVEDSPKITTAPVSAVPWGEATVPADLVLVLVKAWQTSEVARHLDRLLKPDGLALTLQNGLGNQEALGPRAGLGVTYQGATLLGPAHVQPGGEGATWIAGPEWVVELFQRAGMPAQRADAVQMEGLLWGKLAVNCAINPLTAILRVPNGELLKRPDARVLMEGAAGECAAVARGKGVVLPFSDAAGQARAVARRTAGNRSSMLQDVLRGAPTECEAINGAVIRWGKHLDVPTPVNETLYHLVRSLDSTHGMPREAMRSKI
jgi:2-dehydropantoate 2-reductase